jgi:hypothetical protein
MRMNHHDASCRLNPEKSERAPISRHPRLSQFREARSPGRRPGRDAAVLNAGAASFLAGMAQTVGGRRGLAVDLFESGRAGAKMGQLAAS